MYTSQLASIALLGATAVLAKNIEVKVGASGLVFEPNKITASKGDTVAFQIYQGHNVLQGDFSSPCQFKSGGFSSGQIWEKSGHNPDFFVLTINNTDAIYGYCGEAMHCEAGMTFAINAPSSGNTLEAYTKKAESVSKSEDHDEVSGGRFEASVSSGSSSSSTTSAGSSSTTKKSTSTSTSGASAASSSTSTSSGAAPFNAAPEGFAMAILGFAAYFL